MAKKQTTQTIPGHDDGTRLTPEEAAALVRANWAGGELCDNESIGDFLLLLRSIAFSKDEGERDAIVTAIEHVLMPFTPAFNKAVNEILRRRLAVAHSLIKEGGTQ